MVAPGRVDGGSRAPVSGRGSRARPRTSWCCWSPWTSDRSVAAHPGHLAGGTHPLGHEPHDLARSAAHVQAAHARPVLPPSRTWSGQSRPLRSWPRRSTCSARSSPRPSPTSTGAGSSSPAASPGPPDHARRNRAGPDRRRRARLPQDPGRRRRDAAAVRPGGRCPRERAGAAGCWRRWSWRPWCSACGDQSRRRRRRPRRPQGVLHPHGLSRSPLDDG